MHPSGIPEVGEKVSFSPQFLEACKKHGRVRIPSFLRPLYLPPPYSPQIFTVVDRTWLGSSGLVQWHVGIEIRPGSDIFVFPLDTLGHYYEKVLISHGYREGMPLFVSAETPQSSLYCSCDHPTLVTNTVLDKTFQFCRRCKKEKL